MEYDVFISCKSDDYKLAEKVYKFLNDNDIHTFLSSKELRRMKDAEYMDAISQALDSAYHLIVVSSSKDYVISKWVKFEWQTFLNELLSDRKQGQIMTFLDGITIADLPIPLRHYESFIPANYEEKILSYVETPASLQRKEEARQKSLQEAERQKKEKEAQQLRNSIKLEIQASSTEYQRHSSNLDSYAQQIIEKQKQIGNVEKSCPVCKSVQSIENKYCTKCGWTFNPIFDIKPSGDEQQLFIMRGIWKSVKEADATKEDLRKKISILENTIKELNQVRGERDELQCKINELKFQLSSIAENLLSKEIQIEEMRSSNETEKDKLSKSIQQLESEICEREKHIESLKRDLNECQNKLTQVNIDLKVNKDKEQNETKRRTEVERELSSLKNLIKSQNISLDNNKKKSDKGDKKDSTIHPMELPISSSSADETFTVKGVNFKMIFVEGGTFTMGATSEQENDAYDNEKPAHQVTLSGYYMGETEVTQALWEAVMGSNPSNFKGADRPVEEVSWDDVQEFLRKLNQLTGKTFRLPTEAEWEYAARGGNRSKGYKYAGSDSIGEVAWYDGNSSSQTHPVKGKRANELGLYDMSGNLLEWCSDWYGSYSSSSQTNPTGASSGSNRVYRGGSWYNNARCCRSTYRYCHTPGGRSRNLGFRLSLSK